jgi:antitoxin component of MazEF toxin-antitoxin module
MQSRTLLVKSPSTHKPALPSARYLKSGNSMVIRFPREVVAMLNWPIGQPVQIMGSPGALIIRPMHVVDEAARISHGANEDQ